MRSTLNGSRDADAPQEASAIERAERLSGRRPVSDVYFSLTNSALRSRHYDFGVKHIKIADKVLQAARDLDIERLVQDRLLDELLSSPAYRRHLAGE